MHLGERAHLIERRVRACKDYSARPSNISFAVEAYDGRLPPVPGWPRHPLAPTKAAEVDAIKEWATDAITKRNYRLKLTVGGTIPRLAH